MDASTIIFLHIPKTGGTSLQNILLRKYSKDQTVTNAHTKLEELSSWTESKKNNIRYMQGHFSFGAHKLLPQKCEYLTMLRDPIDRVISHYYFLLRNESHPLHRVLLENKMSLEDYVTSGVSAEVKDDQVRLISGIPRDSSMSVSEILNQAKTNIDESFLVTGIMEKFDEALILLKKRLGLHNIFYGIRNQTLDRPSVEQTPAATLELINEHNQLDIALYEYAKRKFINEFEAEGDKLASEVRRFRMFNRPYSYAFHQVRSLKHKLVNGR